MNVGSWMTWTVVWGETTYDITGGILAFAWTLLFYSYFILWGKVKKLEKRGER